MTMPASHEPPHTRPAPLRGKRIILTRPRAQAGDFEERISSLGGEPMVAPAIAIAGPETWTIADAALRRVGTYDWIVFTSANAVRAVRDRSETLGITIGVRGSPRLAAVGSSTATAIAAGLREPDLVSSIATSEALGHELPDIEGARVLLPRGNLADDALPAILRGRGAFVDTIVVYRTVAGDGVRAIVADLQAGVVHALLFASASAVRCVVDALRSDGSDPSETLRTPIAACVGPVTGAAARDAGFVHVVTADAARQDDLIDVVVHWFASDQHDIGGLI